jgi:hypothetical protein
VVEAPAQGEAEGAVLAEPCTGERGELADGAVRLINTNTAPSGEGEAAAPPPPVPSGGALRAR